LALAQLNEQAGDMMAEARAEMDEEKRAAGHEHSRVEHHPE
jgi:hypothetical protein